MKKLILIPIATLTTLTPMAFAVSCGKDQHDDPIDPSECTNIMQVYTPEIETCKSTSLSKEAALDEYKNINGRDNNIFYEDVLYSTSLAFQRWYFPSEYHDFTKYLVKPIVDKTKFSTSKIKFGFDTLISGNKYVPYPDDVQGVKYTNFDIETRFMINETLPWSLGMSDHYTPSDPKACLGIGDQVYGGTLPIHLKVKGTITINGEMKNVNLNKDLILDPSHTTWDTYIWIDLVGRLLLEDTRFYWIYSYYFKDTTITD